MTDSINVEELKRRCAALTHGVQAVGASIKGGEEPCDGSPARKDEQVIGDAEPITTIRSQAQFQIELAADHIFAISRALEPPVSTMAALTLARAVLESSARTMWLLDPANETRERVARSMTIRIADVKAQMKLPSALGDNSPKTREDEIRSQAAARGVGPPPAIPKFTSLAESEFEAAPEYRFLSGLTHGSTTLVRHIGFETVIREKGNSGARKAANPLFIHFALIKSFEWILWPMWRQASYLGRPHQELRDVMNEAANQLKFSADFRFWNESEHFVHWTH